MKLDRSINVMTRQLHSNWDLVIKIEYSFAIKYK